jgi:hypothetical protein
VNSRISRTLDGRVFAPRGEASVGPVPFVHRPSAEGNPDAPLGHALQDGFHDASTVLGLAYRCGRTSVEATAFSGQGVTWPFPLHRLDSYALRLNQDINDQVEVGASYVDTLSPSDTGGKHTRIVSGWLTTSHRIRDDTLKTSFVWGRSLPGGGAAAKIFLEEAVYQHGRNKLFGRAEALQLAPDQLDIATADRPGDPRWVEAFTLSAPCGGGFVQRDCRGGLSGRQETPASSAIRRRSAVFVTPSLVLMRLQLLATVL